MENNLEQSKLNVINKTRSNIFNWRGQFTPQLIEYLLNSYAASSDYIFDPFCGSGTVLLECARKNIDSVACEINPAAFTMARFISLARLKQKDRNALYSSVESRILNILASYGDAPLFSPSSLTYRDQHKTFLCLSQELFARITDKRERLLALITLFYAENKSGLTLNGAITQALKAVYTNLIALPHTKANISVALSDARMSHKVLDRPVNLIITSPPYINVFNYHQNYRAILEVFGYDLLEVAESEIGSNRKNRANRFRTIVQYALDMERVLMSLALSLKDSGYLVLIIGRESRVRGIAFSNSAIIGTLSNNLSCFKHDSSNERSYMNRFGQIIKEDIFILKRLKGMPRIGNAKIIAKGALREATNKAKGEILENIDEAISCIDDIEESPILNIKEIY